MIDIDSKFWQGWYCLGIPITLVLLVIYYFFPNEFEEKGRKKLCELKQYEYCTKEELLKKYE